MNKLKEFQSKGGQARAEKYSKEKLSEWAKKGGRPKKQNLTNTLSPSVTT